MRFITITIFLPLFLLSVNTIAHPGRTAGDGCHYCRTNCEKHGIPAGKRHCHNSSNSRPSVSLTPRKYNEQSHKSHIPSSFSKAKRLLYNKVYQGHKTTFYCNCQFNYKREVDLSSCNVEHRRNKTRANRIEAEHVMPAHEFGMFRACWQSPLSVCGNRGGRACCLKKDRTFKKAHNDLHNLFPSVGEINGDRSNYRWGMISGERRAYGSCDIEVDSRIRRAEPPEQVRGDIARVYFYMSETYRVRLSKSQRQLFEAWNKLDPVDSWEIERNKRIKKIQGSGNPFITK